MKTQLMPDLDLYDGYLTTVYNQIEAELRRALPMEPFQDTANDPTAMVERTITDPDGNPLQWQALMPQKNEHVLLVADDGIGKSFTMQSLTRDAIIERLHDSNKPIPIYAQIRRWNVHKAPPLHFWLSTQTSLDPTEISELIETGRAVLLLDGLDDLSKKFQKMRSTQGDPRRPFLERLPTTCPIILSTTSNDTSAIQHNNISRTVHLHPLNNDQIKDYLDGSRRTQALWQTVEAYPTVLDELRKPIILKMLAGAFRDKPQALADLTSLDDGGQIRDVIFTEYVQQQFQNAKRREASIAFDLDQVYWILGLVATRGVIKYGTGNVAMIPINLPHWDDMLVVDDLRFGFLNTTSTYGMDFLNFAEQLSLITPPRDGLTSYTFVHPIIRDLLVIQHCMPLKEKMNSYTIESLMRINDPRKYDAFTTVILGDFSVNQKLQAFAALEYDLSAAATHTMQHIAMSTDDRFFADRVRESLKKREQDNIKSD